VKQVRAIYLTYLAVILLGIVYCTVLGLLGR
jgi:hypothetical protein